MENAINNNNITLAGVVEREPEYSHEVLGEGFMYSCSSVQEQVVTKIHYR